MDKTMLLMMLAQQAPRLLAALKQGGGLENFPNVNAALNNGYDPLIMDEYLEEYPDGTFGVGGYLGNLDFLYDSTNYSRNGIVPSEGWLDFKNKSPMDIQASAGQMIDNNPLLGGSYHPAEMSALSMLEQNPNIGLEDPKKKLFKKLTKQ